MFRNYLDKIERDEDVRKNLIELRKLLKTEPGSAAWQRDRQRCLSLMLKLLKHEDAKVRKNAALILGEMGCQDAYQTYFKDRSLFYSTFPIREQAPKGSDWNFCLKKVYVVALLNYRMSDEAFDSSDTIHTIALMDTKTNKVFNAKLMFKYVEVGRFDKTDDELISLSDKWMYVLKNLSRLDNRPSSLREKIFTKLFDAAAIARFTPMELREYEDSLKAYRDIKNSLDTAKEEGRAEGRAEGIAMVVKNMHAKGMDIDVIASITGLNKDEVESLCL